ncbi:MULTISPECIES: hypothetical protein [unclassified Lysinibacillus]
MTKKFLFWNINKKNCSDLIVKLVDELSIDVIILAELIQQNASNKGQGNAISLANLISNLNIKTGKKFISRFNSGQKIVLIDSLQNGQNVSSDEDKRLSSCKYRINNEDILVVGVHLRDRYTHNVDDLFDLAGQHREFIDSYNVDKVIAIGDFNMNPYEKGIMGATGFNAIFSKEEICYNPDRNFGIKKTPFYYNASWDAYKLKSPQGTYYYENKDTSLNPYWNLLDQVLFSSAMMDTYIGDSFKIITTISGNQLLRDKKSKTTKITKKVINKKISDHLPIVFEVDI